MDMKKESKENIECEKFADDTAYLETSLKDQETFDKIMKGETDLMKE